MRIKITKNIFLKTVRLNDVNYILKLRTDKVLSKHINPTSKKKIDQINWLKKYFIRKKNKKEFYFIFQIKSSKKYKNLGFARIVHLKKNVFHFGGWVLNKETEPWISLESCCAIYKYAFLKLKYKSCLLWINLKNKKVIKFHKNLGAKYIKKDNKEVYLKFKYSDFLKLKKKYNYFF